MDPRRPKRTKVTAACSACVKRKSRCELLMEDGCHRCRILGTSCSLRQSASGDLFADQQSRSPTRENERSARNGKRPAEPEEQDDTLRARLEELEGRLRAVEAELGRQRRRRSLSPPRANGRSLVSPRAIPIPAAAPPTHAAHEESLGRALIKHPAPYTAIPELLGVDFDAAWFGPVRSGLLSTGQMNGAYLCFQNTFAEILPLRSAVAAPSHPFLQSCILAYLALLPPTLNPLTPDQSREILSRIGDDVSHAISSPPSFTTIKSLLILAHLPGFPQIPPPEGGKALPSVSAVVQIAKGMARGLGMDRAVPSMVGMEDDCLMGLDGYVVWRCLLQQEFWISLIMSAYVPTDPLPDLPPSLEAELTASPDARDRASVHIIRHIRATAGLQERMKPLLELVQRVGDDPREEDFQEVKRAFGVFLEDVARWFTGFEKGDAAGRYLYIAARHFDYAVHLRVAGWIQRLPRPIISEQLYHLLQYVGRSLIQASMQVIVNLSAYKDLQPSMPGCNHTLSIFAWAGLMNIQALFKHDPNAHDWTGRRHRSHLESFEGGMINLFPDVAGRVMRQLKDWVARVQPHVETRKLEHKETNVWDASVGGNGSYQTATSDLRHQPSAFNYPQEYPPLATFPPTGSIGLLPPPPADFTVHGFPSGSTTGMPSGLPFLGEFTAQEMAAFEAWWFDMLEVDGTPSGAGTS
ncbi:hypothetical protein NCC49_006057 [Naganishia albida]|nr:hypothetical protein NCC49_006057 [Naganishia albida]